MPAPGDGGDTGRPGRPSINLGSQNINFTLPVLSLGGRAGLDLNLALSYNSKVWNLDSSTNKIFFNADKSFPAPGWRIGFGAVQGINNGGSINPYTNGASGKLSYIYVEPDGTRHDLALNSTTGLYESYDSSYMDFNVTTKVLRLSNGTQITCGTTFDYQFLPTEIKDRNGNRITVTNAAIQNGDGAASNGDVAIDYITDTLGRTIDFYYESNRLLKVRQNRGGTWFDYLVITWVPVTITTNFGSLGLDPSTINGTQVWEPWFLQYPNGANVKLFYTSYGQLHELERWVPTVVGQGSGRPVIYTRFDLPSYNGQSYPAGSIVGPATSNATQTDCPKFASRWEWAENWNGGVEAQTNYYFDSTNNFSTVTDPTGRIYRTDTSTTSTTQTITAKVFANATAYNNGAGTPSKTVTTVFGQDSGPSYVSNQRVTDSQITDGSYTRHTSLTYTTSNGVTLPADVSEYNADATTVYRRTHTDYNWGTAYTSRHIFGLASQLQIYTGGGTLLAQTAYTYDETAYFLDASADNVIAHDSAYNGVLDTILNSHLVGMVVTALITVGFNYWKYKQELKREKKGKDEPGSDQK